MACGENGKALASVTPSARRAVWPWNRSNVGTCSPVTLNSFTVPLTGLEGQALPMSAQASTDVTGASLTYSWNFGDGNSASGVNLTDVSHAYAAPATPGTPYTVTLTVSDGTGSTSATGSLTVTDVPPTVNAGPSQTIRAGGTATFNASVTDPGGSGDVASIQWDFNYNGTTFNPGSANTLTPQHVFTAPGTSTVALQVTDVSGASSLSTLTVTVNPVSTLIVNAGPDQSILEGAMATFAGTWTDASGTVNPSTADWDFNYNGSTFNPDSSAHGTLTPSHVFNTPGVYLVVTVTDVAPTATVTNSGATPEGSPVTFTVANVVDLNPSDTVQYLADWTGSGQFELITSDELTTNPNGSVSFTHVYDDNATYAAKVRVLDGSGGYTDYASTVTVTDVAPTATFGPSGGNPNVTATVPFIFLSPTSPSHADMLAGFTYFFSVDGGSYSSNTTGTFFLPSGLALGSHTVAGYLVNKDGGTSPVYTSTINLQSPQVTVENTGTGQVQLTWTGNPGAVVISPNQPYVIAGTADGLTMTLLTAGANYQLYTNGSVALVNASPGAQNFTLTLDTTNQVASTTAGAFTLTATRKHRSRLTAAQLSQVPVLGPSVGDGHVGEIDLPANSTVSVYSRGYLGSIVGPAGLSSHTAAQAVDLYFANLTGSITGLDHVANLNLTGWLGTGPSQQVAANAGIDSISAYGIGATVTTDRNFNAGDPSAQISVRDGGVPGVLIAGNVSSFQARGDVNQFSALMLSGDAGLPVPSTVNDLYLGGWGSTSKINAPMGTLIKQLLLAKSPTSSAVLINLQVKGALLVMADAPKEDKNSKSFWMDKADAALQPLKPPPLPDDLQLRIAYNKKITAAYAKLYSENPQRFQWLGLAAFASQEVGATLSVLRTNQKAALKDGDGKLAKALFDAGIELGDGNGAVYDDIYWQYLAYADGGIDQMRKLNATKDGKGKPMLSDNALKAWELIAEGEKKKDPNKIWDGNQKIAFLEQHDLLQPQVFDKVSAQIAGKYFSDMAGALFPTATPFIKAVPGGNLAKFDDRWNWISNFLWKDWRKFNEANSDWKVGNNPLKNAMKRFIDIGNE